LSFQSAAKVFFGNDFSHDLTRMFGEYNKVQHLLDGHKELLEDLRETNNSLLETKTNKTVKKLTALSFIMLPLSLIAGIFGMNMGFIYIKNDAPPYNCFNSNVFNRIINVSLFKI
jgi:magnesium transporter